MTATARQPLTDTRSSVNGSLTPNRPTAQTESDQFGAFARRILRAYSRRVADRDIEGLAGLVAVRDEADRATATAVAALREQGFSWADVARVIGCSRQAAQQRYGR